jgi:hypothetical protein
MLTTGFPFRRLLAVLLPIAFFWTFVACISLCTRESLEAHNHSTSVRITTTEDVPHCGGCPLNFFPKATTPEQQKFTISLEPLGSFAPEIRSDFYPATHVLSTWVDSPPVTASPPLELLLALRI